MATKITDSLDVYFWSRVNILGEDDCWEWSQSKRNGYGRFGLNRKLYSAHRVAYELANNMKLDKNIKVLHKCDNPPCCNPNHLFLGTQLDNMQDMKSKGRLYDRSGHKNPNVRLNESDVMNVYRLKNSGLSNNKISKIVGVGESTIWRIVTGFAWKELYEQVTQIR